VAGCCSWEGLDAAVFLDDLDENFAALSVQNADGVGSHVAALLLLGVIGNYGHSAWELKGGGVEKESRRALTGYI